MNRITLTLDKNGHLVRTCADKGVEVLIIGSDVPQDWAYRWNSL
jgi:hypothetical protein